MGSEINVTLDCRLAGEFVDELEAPPGLVCQEGEAVPTRFVASFVDECGPDGMAREFTVLLRDKSVITVHGHGLKYVQNPANPADYGSYAVLASAAGREVTVALFPVSEVTGVFSGGMRLPGPTG